MTVLRKSCLVHAFVSVCLCLTWRLLCIYLHKCCCLRLQPGGTAPLAPLQVPAAPRAASDLNQDCIVISRLMMDRNGYQAFICTSVSGACFFCMMMTVRVNALLVYLDFSFSPLFLSNHSLSSKPFSFQSETALKLLLQILESLQSSGSGEKKYLLKMTEQESCFPCLLKSR